jgi:hypothetical protein
MPAQNDSGVDARVRDLESRARGAEGRLRTIEIDAAGVKKWMERVTERMPTFVTKTEFGPVKMIAYGMAGTILTSILTAALAKLIVK